MRALTMKRSTVKASAAPVEEASLNFTAPFTSMDCLGLGLLLLVPLVVLFWRRRTAKFSKGDEASKDAIPMVDETPPTCRREHSDILSGLLSKYTSVEIARPVAVAAPAGLSVCGCGFEDLDDGYTVYNVCAHAHWGKADNTSTFDSKHRYSDFLALHKTLGATNEKLRFDFPVPKTLFAWTTQHVKTQRVVALQEYLNTVSSLVETAPPELLAFLAVQRK